MGRPSVVRAGIVLGCLLFVWGAAAGRAQAGGADGCATCHAGQAGPLRVVAGGVADDVHTRAEIGCADCHGGDPVAEDAEVAHSAASGFRGVPEGRASVNACGGCHRDPEYVKRFNPNAHVDQIEQYLTSGHGRRLLEGDTKTATCVSCHGAHGMRPVSDPESPVSAAKLPGTCGRCHGDAEYMAGRDRPTDIVQKYAASVHGRALLERGLTVAPNCGSCHGSHGTDKPDVDSVANVCGRCHPEQAALFRATTKRRVFDAGGSPECVVCHSQHDIRPTTDSMLGVGPESLCTSCHFDPDDPGARTSQRLAAAFTRILTRFEETGDQLRTSLDDGVDVRALLARLGVANAHVGRARVLVHSFDEQRILRELDTAEQIIVSAETDGEAVAARHRTRRRLIYVGVAAGVFLAAILFLCLWVRIREAEEEDLLEAQGASQSASQEQDSRAAAGLEDASV